MEKGARKRTNHVEHVDIVVVDIRASGPVHVRFGHQDAVEEEWGILASLRDARIGRRPGLRELLVDRAA